MALFRPSGSQKASIVFSMEEMLAYRDTWVTPFEMDIEELLRPAPAAPSAAAAPVVPLQMSDKGFKTTATAELAKDAQLVRLVQATLNKLTQENFDVLLPTLLQPSLFEPGVAAQVVDKVFRKSLEEPKYAWLYATLCLRLAQYEHSVLEKSKLVRTSILEKAQEVYESQMNVKMEGSDEEVDKLRKRKLANIKFVAHLSRHGLLAPKIIVRIAHSVMGKPSEIDLEVVLTLLRKVGDIVDPPNQLDAVWERLAALQEPSGDGEGYSQRIRFLIMNLFDLRRNNWKRPEDEAEPMTPATPGPAGSLAAEASLVFSQACLEQRPHLAPEMSDAAKTKVFKALEHLRDDPIETFKVISTQLRDQNATINRVACLAYAIDNACQSTKEATRLTVGNALTHAKFDKAEVRAAIAWAIANAVTCAVREDCPKYFDRLAELLLRFAPDTAGSLGVIRDSVVTAASHLDAVLVSLEGVASEWDESYLAMWTAYVVALKRAPVQFVLGDLMDAMSGFKSSGLASRTLTDVISAVADNGLCTYKDLTQWHSASSKVPELRVLIAASSLLV